MTSTNTTQPIRFQDCQREVVLGVDTHKDAHVAAVISTTGKLIGSRSFPATADGYQQLLGWARSSGLVSRAGCRVHRFLRSRAEPISAHQRADRHRR